MIAVANTGAESLPEQMHEPIELVHIIVNTLDVYIPLQQVERITQMVALLPVPQGPDYLKGLMSVGGHTLPVIDLGERLGWFSDAPYSLDTPILICRGLQQLAGLIVDDVIGVEPANSQQIHLQSAFRDSETAVMSVVNSVEGLSLLLDLDKVLGLELSACQDLLDDPDAIIEFLQE